IQSLRRVSALGARQICFPHFACTEEVELLKAHAEQIKAWREAARSVKERGGGVEDLLVELQRVDENAAKIAGRRGLLHDFFLMQTLIGLLQSA
ncbi:MAG: MBL fold metallo-hydrolase, partial [Thermoproteus sp.]